MLFLRSFSYETESYYPQREKKIYQNSLYNFAITMRSVPYTLQRSIVGIVLLTYFPIAFFLASAQSAHATLKPHDANKFYWQYNGAPVLLVGGSIDDNLFQISGLQAHLDEMKAVGANYIRNTMSDRDPGNLKAFLRLSNGKYDLNQWNNAYWTNFENLLRWSRDRNIIVQIEIWDRFDHARSTWADPWGMSPYNPKNNINFTSAQSGLATTYTETHLYFNHPFFHTVPALHNNAVLLHYQNRFVDKMLSISLNYPNVLYVMDNETNASLEWGKYWSQRINAAAAAKGVLVYTTEMWNDLDITNTQHKQTLNNPTLFSFSDISQNNSMFDQTHWDRIQWVRSYLADRPWPINNTKIYGAGTNTGSNARAGLERFWRNVIGGAASARFHRPNGGLGLNNMAKGAITAVRKLETMVKMWEVTPGNDLLSTRATDEAYLAAKPGEKYALYFTNGGAVGLNLSGHAGRYMLRWINGSTGSWGSEQTISGGSTVTINAPGSGHWVAGIVKIPSAP